MTAFTASNGWTIVEELRCLKIVHPNHYLRFIDLDIAAALREYFQHERDQELGRWRDPENPDRLVYPIDGEAVRVTNETDGEAVLVTRKHLDRCLVADAFPCDLARRYFDAHPEPKPKPWEDAEPGEVWALTRKGNEFAALVVHWGEGTLLFNWNEDWCSINDPTIRAGRRIWPEQEDGE